MPQMMPMLWTIIYLFSLLVLGLLIFMLYFMKLYFLNKTLNKSPIQVTIWNWKW
ncbi:ATP synthase F0 subunit 8 (mitochondrion) [Linepithema humile]|uniref:ATP synthase F0 subunit 8 n=1 Tax=Linepithema humile TaxID=83485 RepID=A0A191TFV3_LINHU|nr:ATP synthase F0 subunit 8 [Linepithema humile]ANI87494.1 ATP synthase F0 subunit 8 [Linepithema humile]QNV47344.1 ATP synthase F0 subunit 8 [Linepithema humile]